MYIFERRSEDLKKTRSKDLYLTRDKHSFTMLRFCLTIIFLGYAGGMSLGILEMIYHFSGFPTLPRSWTWQNEVPDHSVPFDFLVIGAGSAGSVLVNRLTENPDWRILVLEQGNDEIFLTDIPFLAPILYKTDYARLYKSEPRPQDANGQGGYCISMVDGQCNVMSGRAVGGTSVVNFMIYSRGAPADYDAWQALGNPGWSYEDVLPYFIKSERCKLTDKDVRYHGYNGYLDVTIPPYSTPLKESFLKAGQELGYDLVDYNSDRLIGFSGVQSTLRNGRRVSAGKAFLRPIRDRPNFYLSKFATVTKIVINPKTKTAVGVEFIKNHRTYFVSATKEIILCAGALNSPQLLMLSGIGPKDHLSSLGIHVIEDLPVGFNLQDHVSMSALTFLVNESVTIDEPRLSSNPSIFLDYLIQGTGPLTIPAGAEALAFFNTKAHLNMKKSKFNSIVQDENIYGYSAWTVPDITSITVDRDIFKTYPNGNKLLTEDDYPDIEVVLGVSSLAGDVSGVYRNLLGLSDNFYKEVFSNYDGFNAFTLVPVLLRPKSRGRITLRSTNPLDLPIVDLNYYDNEDDLNKMVQAIKIAMEIASTRAFKRYNVTLLPVSFPGCKHIAFKSDAYWACVARHVTTNVGHYSGTCKMSTRKNSGVVDHRLRVHGINGLRVVDISIMPTIIAGHTTAPAYMIGEKASDMIKEDWKDFAP
ncbi:glucose dehydrogenase [FAD, quinone]-like [Nylanderia fulva]|uniref:glucose dehydrogenase [FAD, quinone]-like n=1 Tax=Nylanderia fulva TaxID=613905 RepID=UPI0010FAF295|nr:glucose dehydrogenase [FAD, quinone]-like [Nylanderia fulva]